VSCITTQIKRIFSLSLLLISNTPTAYAGAFSLYTESSAVEIGNYAAGAAAEAPDASIGWYNPAGLVLLHHTQGILSGVGVFPSTQISGQSSFNTTSYPSYVQSFHNLQGAKSDVVPAVHVAVPLNDNTVFGVSLVSPMGESTNWSETSAVRYAATETKLMTVNASPEMGFLLTDHLAAGAGLDLQWAQVTFNAILGIPTLYKNLVDSASINKGSSFGVGFHAGVLGLFNQEHSRIGLNYQSGVAHKFYGYSSLTGKLADPAFDELNPFSANPESEYLVNALSSNNVQFPSIVTLSGYQDLTPQWAILGSVIYTGWNVFKTITLDNVAAFTAYGDPHQMPLQNTAIEDYRDAWRFAAGMNYHVTERWMMRVGGGYDQTPTIDAQRDVRLPDVDRWALSVGSHLQATPSLGIDVGYTFLFGANNASPINKDQILDPNNSVTVTGTAKNFAQLAGIQAVWAFDGVKAA
jgi:long-chain fatty acid transport protein